MVLVTLTRVADGVARTFQRDEDLSTLDYAWHDGNYSCDCNRELFFARAADEPEPEINCSDGRFRARIVRVDTGAVVYEEPPT